MHSFPSYIDTCLGCNILGYTHLSLCYSMSCQLDNCKVSLSDRPLDVVKADTNWGFLSTFRHLEIDHHIIIPYYRSLDFLFPVIPSTRVPRGSLLCSSLLFTSFCTLCFRLCHCKKKKTEKFELFLSNLSMGSR